MSLKFMCLFSLLSFLFFKSDTAQPSSISGIDRSKECTWYAVVHPCGGINNNRVSMMDALVFAYLLNFTLVLPHVPVRDTMCHGNRECASYGNKGSWWRRTKNFSYIWDSSNFRAVAKQMGVVTIDQLPACLEPLDTLEAQTGVHASWDAIESVYGKASGFLRNVEQILAVPQWLGAKQCLGGSRPMAALPGWQENCNAGFHDFECGLYAFEPSTDFEWYLWEKAFDAFKFGPNVHQHANTIVSAIGGSYISLHLRIEPDADLHPFTGFDSHANLFAAIRSHLATLIFDANEPIYVSVGLPISHPLLQDFLASLKEFKFVFGETLSNVTKETSELEFKAAVEFEVCSQSRVHLGFYRSTFDMMLHVARRPKGLTSINIDARGQNDPEVEKIFSPVMFP